MIESRSHQILRSRIEYLRTHMELADASLRLLFNGLNRKNASDQISDALTIDCRRYTQIKLATFIVIFSSSNAMTKLVQSIFFIANSFTSI